MIEPTDRQIMTFLLARYTPDGVAPGFVRDEIDECLDPLDGDTRDMLGISRVSGLPYLRCDEGLEFQMEIVRAGLRAVLNMGKS